MYSYDKCLVIKEPQFSCYFQVNTIKMMKFAALSAALLSTASAFAPVAQVCAIKELTLIQ